MLWTPHENSLAGIMRSSTGCIRLRPERPNHVCSYDQDDLRILRIVLVPAVMQGLARSGQSDRGYQLQLETRLAEMMCERSVVVTVKAVP